MSISAQNSKVHKGLMGILRDDIPVAGVFSSPDYLASVLEKEGYKVRFVSARDLCNEKVMKKENFDVLVLPYGGSYPAMGKDALISYLKGGGIFLSMGGYAFDNLLVRSNDNWEPLPKDSDIRINTRKGEARDSLGLHPDQIGVFDPSYPLKRVSYMEAAPDQFVFDEKFRMEGEFEGYAASSMAGSNSPVFPQRYGRWIPLLYARDAYGRLRGSAGAMVHNYAGPYAGSSWAYFGVTNHDLFPPDNEMARSALISLVDNLMQKRFLTELSTELACYRPGEKDVRISAAGSAECDVQIQVFAEDDKPVFEWQGSLSDGKTEITWSPDKFESDFYRVRARMMDGDQPVDVMDTGFVVWDEGIVSNGFPLSFSENYFRFEDRAMFLSGTNQTGMMFASANENPLVWKRDLEGMANYGVNILRILHFSPFVVSYTGHPRAMPGDLNVDAMPRKLERQLDAIVQLCQKYRVILFLSLHDWMGVELSDEELEAQRKFAQVVTSRYRDVPGIMYDVQNEPSMHFSNEDVTRGEFEKYLKEKYGGAEGQKAAWKRDVSDQDLAKMYNSSGTEEWGDVAALDVNYFKTTLLNRWVKANAEGVTAGDPGRPLTVGYLPSMYPADKILGTEQVDFSNMHFYGGPRDFARQLKITDRRFEGKSFSLGEFGAKVHPTWRLGGSITTMRGGIDWFLRVGHYSLGMGASFIANWDWKDMPDCIFPWGINHPCDVVPKDILLAYRSQSMFFRYIAPRYEEPEVYFLVPDNHRLGGQMKSVTEAILNGIDLLLGCHVDFGVINEYSLHKLPGSAKVIIYPIPFCPSHETYHLVTEFVRNGGVLYLSGDISYDEYRNRTEQERLQELCGVQFVSERYPNVSGSREPGPCIRVEPVTAEVLSRSDDGWPLAMTNSLGRGRVFYCTDPVEFHTSAPDVYREFLNFAGVERIPLEPDDPSIRAFRIPTAADETVYILFNESEEKKQVTLNTEANRIALEIGPGKPGLVKMARTGEILALESQGKVMAGSETLMNADGHVMLCALDEVGIDESKSLMILPIEPCNVSIAVWTHWEKPVIGVGEIRGGKYHFLDKMEAGLSDGYLSFRINDIQSLNVLLIAETNWLDRLAEEL